ncbi:hypothetical protein [Helicobacter felis]|uniref:hypothetical protein n=1 Tax=Helicobacter felis TaxID=214 RepID=UPI000CED82EF|nr:hypothetical protein [Helicobacter felis]
MRKLLLVCPVVIGFSCVTSLEAGSSGADREPIQIQSRGATGQKWGEKVGGWVGAGLGAYAASREVSRGKPMDFVRGAAMGGAMHDVGAYLGGKIGSAIEDGMRNMPVEHYAPRFR